MAVKIQAERKQLILYLNNLIKGCTVYRGLCNNNVMNIEVLFLICFQEHFVINVILYQGTVIA